MPTSPLTCRLDGTLSASPEVQLCDQPSADAKRRYPWGDDPDPNRANFDETKVGSTSAVGCFPGGVSMYGCQDLSGNVWEWTRSAWEEKYPYSPPGAKRDERESFTDATRPRVLRGGAFNISRWSARCASRYHLYPSNRDTDARVSVGGLPISLWAMSPLDSVALKLCPSDVGRSWPRGWVGLVRSWAKRPVRECARSAPKFSGVKGGAGVGQIGLGRG